LSWFNRSFWVCLSMVNFPIFQFVLGFDRKERKLAV
jgi:hypothetical protein